MAFPKSFSHAFLPINNVFYKLLTCSFKTWSDCGISRSYLLAFFQAYNGFYLLLTCSVQNLEWLLHFLVILTCFPLNKQRDVRIVYVLRSKFGVILTFVHAFFQAYKVPYLLLTCYLQNLEWLRHFLVTLTCFPANIQRNLLICLRATFKTWSDCGISWSYSHYFYVYALRSLLQMHRVVRNLF